MNIETVWSEYRASLKSFLHTRVSNTADVDDLLQEILIKTHKNLHSVKSEGSLKSWLFQIANHAIIDFYRKKGKPHELSADDLWYEEDVPEAEQSLARCITPFINALPDESARLLTAIDLNGESQKAYADALGISYSTLKSRVQKSRRLLRGLFNDCCELSLDRNGNIVDFDAKSGRCKKC